ncbi:MAG: hypothetical protein V1725_00635 [archaeon]
MFNMTEVAAASISITEIQSSIQPLLLFIFGVVVYSIFIFKFYRFLARKDIFKLSLHKYNKTFLGVMKAIFGVVLYILEYLIIFPIFILFWFGVISLILIVLSTTVDVSQILLVAMALVASIRITAFYNEDLSKDLAKMFPFALLAVFLLDITVFSYSTFLARLSIIPGLWKQMLYYLMFTIVLELILRVGYSILKPRVSKHEEG